MSGVLVDTNIILDIATEDTKWFEWSSRQLSECAEKHTLFINKIIYAEVSIGYKKIEDLEAAIHHSIFKRATIPWEAAFLAGKTFLRYKKLGDNRSQPLPDFFIAAHAVIDGLTLLTRDGKRFRHYFPTLKLISPNKKT